MRVLFAALAVSVGVVAAYSPFVIPSLTTHQPIGSGSTNFYYVNFEVKSDNSGKSSSAWCSKSWGDNGWTRLEAYSVNVPTGQWINCDSEEGAYDGNSAFQFQLYPYFSIGNFSVSVKQDLGRGSSITAFRSFNNGTSQFTCDINPIEHFPSQHASGDCGIPAEAGPFRLPVSRARPRGYTPYV
ncbi:hypothetical protein Slin15195_G107340 [Septoria linicola]|uniref:AA1-like domain-containing protein n=1 Tax=Septoria linicola TaxID=215465 RepID=A0A9Q9B3A9_9PEZI|nr:hypothetical protein Slin14017_G070290 [Septoria linicola]USW57415.1 hypothetical protein Slin15195_G107340 [Septoria linicola]